MKKKKCLRIRVVHMAYLALLCLLFISTVAMFYDLLTGDWTWMIRNMVFIVAFAFSAWATCRYLKECPWN
jgi:hypothetical protein